MENRDLKYFMRRREAEIVSVPGPESFRDDDGNVLQLEVKKLMQEEIDKINNAYFERTCFGSDTISVRRNLRKCRVRRSFFILPLSRKRAETRCAETKGGGNYWQRLVCWRVFGWLTRCRSEWRK